MGIETFRSRARVIDLLGRQQIADAPTATGELFKNALDAGAKRVQVDYVDTEHGHGVGFLRISDDGLGMRLQEDVVEKWLVLATESKFAKKSDDGWAKFATEEQRQWIKTAYGEKGIGRLSVASLGRMTILWSVWGDGAEKRGALCIVHWHLFQHPKKLLDDLPIPCAEFDHVPSVQEFDSVFSELRKCHRSGSYASVAAIRPVQKETKKCNCKAELKIDCKVQYPDVYVFTFRGNHEGHVPGDRISDLRTLPPGKN